MDIGRINPNNTTGLNSKAPLIKKDTSAIIDTLDKLQKSEGQTFFSRVKSFVRENITGTGKSNEAGETKQAWGEGSKSPVKTGAIAGTSIGGVAGATIGYLTTETDPNKLPTQTVELRWQEPVLQKGYLGEIPKDYYEPLKGAPQTVGKEISTAFKMFAQSVEHSVDPTKSVYANDVPVKAYPEGVLMADRHEIFTGKGELNVDWQTKGIEEPYLAGANETLKYDTHKITIGHNPDGKPVTQEVINGVHHQFTPEIRYQEVGEYQKPNVEFNMPDPWERAGMGLAIGSIAGLGIGTLAGLIYKVIHRE